MRQKDILKRKEIVIFNSLRKDSRRKLQEISKETRIPISTAYDILNKLRNDFLERFTIIPRYGCLGYNTHAMMIVRPDKDKKENLKRFLMNTNHINSLYLIDGSDFFLDAILKDNCELNRLISHLEKEYNVKEYKTLVVFDEIKREGFLIDEFKD